MSVTIRQIAAVAGVSRGTVDRVLHSRPGVKPEIAEHVRRIADELGFEPNRAGKALAARKTPIRIGCFLPGVGNEFFADVVRGFRRAEAQLRDFGVSVDVREVEGFDDRSHIGAMAALRASGCGALCVSTVDTPAIRAYIDETVAAGIPVVTVNTDLTATRRLCYVGCDYRKGGATAAGLLSLMRLPQARLLIVTGSLQMKGHNERVRGFSRTLRERGAPYVLEEVFESLDNDEHAYRLTRDALREHPGINCIYIAAAGVAGVCRAVCEAGRERELHILAHDEVPSTLELVRAGVIDFTIGQEPEEQGYHAVQMLFDYLMGPGTPPADYITGTVVKIRENIESSRRLPIS